MAGAIITRRPCSSGRAGGRRVLAKGTAILIAADTTPAGIRGTASGLVNLGTGVAMLLASLLAGWPWELYGPPATGYAGTALTGLALAGALRTPAAGPGPAGAPGGTGRCR